MQANVLPGMHDREGLHVVPVGGWCVDTVSLTQNPTPTDYNQLRGDINWIVRLNWGYGTTGTIPLPIDYGQFAERCANYVARSNGADLFIIGNEPNHEQERPNGVIITPRDYATCFVLCRDAIKRVRPTAQVLPAPCAPYHADPTNWLDYWREMLTIISVNGGCGGIPIHAYPRSSNPDAVTSEAEMGPPLQGQYSGFLTYRDALFAVPPALEHLPAYITEFNVLLPDGWPDSNTGVVQAAFEEVNDWNRNPHNQQIRALVLYRFPKFDKWHIEGKAGVIADFRAACALGFVSPAVTASTVVNNYLPSVSSGSSQPAPVQASPERDIDVRAIDRGVTIETPQVAPGQEYWFVKEISWYNEAEADRIGPDRHILADALDANGRREVGVKMLVKWPSGEHMTATEAKPGEPYSANYPMSPSRNDFSIQVIDGIPSEVIKGIGMGADTPEGFNPGAHTSTGVVFGRRTMPAAAMPVPTQPAPQVPVQGVPTLVHPIADPRYRAISQGFGERPDYYKQWLYDGVPLKGHNGIDFAAPAGAVINAVDAGTVVKAENEVGGFGNHVKIVHAWGETVYAHMREMLVEVNERVGGGEIIGTVGSTGASTGNHLHFGVRLKGYNRADGWGGFVDPAKHLINASTPSQPVQAKQPPARESYLQWFRQYGQQYGVEWHLLAAMAYSENKYRATGDSHMGAQGLMQFMPDTWADMQAQIGVVDPLNPEQSIKAAAYYLTRIRSYLLDFNRTGTEWVLAGYNWGSGHASQATWAQVPPETRAYADEVIEFSEALRRWEDGW